ncbi:MAG TPA: hypothetical protein VLB04_07930 [Methanotrichaceae archaeon]|nr:hypothetical protein [Methanotrichaceae archaeon]
MNGIALVILLLALLCAGCVDQEGNDGGDKVDAKTASGQASAGEDKLSLAITSPRPGDILTGDKEFDFSADVKGGKGPYTYSWTSNIDGPLSSEKSFSLKASELSKGGHTLILRVTDSSGSSAQSSVLIRVM